MTRHRLLISAVFIAALVGVLLVPTGARWRTQVLLLKARGRLPDVSWGELFRMLPPHSGFYLEPLTETENPYVSITDPFDDSASAAAGQALFSRTCAQCHLSGRAAPDLVRGTLSLGDADWALYRVITRGVPGTGMHAQGLTPMQAWQVITYVQQSRAAGNGSVGPSLTVAPAPVVDSGRILAGPGNQGEWLTYSGGYDGHRYSPLAQITPASAGHLSLQWAFQISRGLVESEEATPIVAGSRLYVTGSPNQVWALDARTGVPLWHYVRDLPDRLSLCCGEVNRGVAVLADRVYVATLDAHLICLDARTGRALWDVAVGDWKQGYTITSAPLVVGNRVITGVAGGEFGARGFIAAFDARSGRLDWRFEAVLPPPATGTGSWGGTSWLRGGAPTWLTGSYDPQTHLLYWGVGNPGPNYAGGVRPGTNLYSNSVVALDIASGRLRWYFQFTPHDDHDWDAAQTPLLVDGPVGGRVRHLLVTANRNGFFYELDRETGQFILARAFEQQTWASGIDSSGAPHTLPAASPSPAGTHLFPSVVGATNWWSPAYSPRTRLVYVPALHAAGVFYLDPDLDRGGMFTGGASRIATEEPHWTSIKAVDPQTGSVRWEYRMPSDAVIAGGLAATGGGVVFGGGGPMFVALDAASGREVWKLNTGGPINAAPIVYLADGKERVAIMAGRTLMVFGLPR